MISQQRDGVETEDDLIALARQFNDAWNAADVDRVMSFFADDANVRIIPPPAPPAPEIYSGRDAIREWVSRTLAAPFQVVANNYRAAGSVVTWDASFPLEEEDGSDQVAEAVFDGSKIVDFIP
jgi:hypothetical protein